jgi:hypothetical protein
MMWRKDRTKVSAQIFNVAADMLSGPETQIIFMFKSSSKSKAWFNSILCKELQVFGAEIDEKFSCFTLVWIF